MRLIAIFGTILFLTSCMKGKSVDTIVHNAKIHAMDEGMHEYEAMAIRDGKILELGPERQIMNKYSAEEYIDAEKRDVYPGFTDAHGHMMSFARMKLSVDLFGASSMEDLLVRTEKWEQKNNLPFVVGRGWDQTLVSGGEMPSNTELNRLFPNKPVVLHRIDGHAALVNEKALQLAGISPDTKVEGGKIEVKEGKCTGILLDNAINLVTAKLPDFKKSAIRDALVEVQQELLQYGITGVHEAGVDYADLQLLVGMNSSGKLKLNTYVMLFPTEKNRSWAKKNGVLEEGKLTVRSFKVMGDGALGSHGAFLKLPYADDPENVGLLTTKKEELQEVARLARSIGYQLNVHAIGDATNRLVLEVMKEQVAKIPDHRWRIEHAQVVDPADLALFSELNVIPSVQPVHAVSDRHWAEKRLGKGRLKGAYAYASLLNAKGMLAIGTDFPVEHFNPFLTIQAAVYRTNADNEPIGGFLPEEAISFEDCIRGMTLWAAIAAFQENRLGTLERDKDATFVILQNALKPNPVFTPNFAHKVFVNGKLMYETA